MKCFVKFLIACFGGVIIYYKNSKQPEIKLIPTTPLKGFRNSKPYLPKKEVKNALGKGFALLKKQK